jgi:hypothetical protein
MVMPGQRLLERLADAMAETPGAELRVTNRRHFFLQRVDEFHKLSRASSAFDVPNNFVVSYTNPIPFDKIGGRRTG